MNGKKWVIEDNIRLTYNYIQWVKYGNANEQLIKEEIHKVMQQEKLSEYEASEKVKRKYRQIYVDSLKGGKK